MTNIGSACFEIEAQAGRVTLPHEGAEALPRWSPARLNRCSTCITTNPSGQIVKLIPFGQDRRETDDATGFVVSTPEQSLNEVLVPNFAFAWPDQVTFVDDNILRTECVFVAASGSSRAIERRDREPKARERPTE